MVSLVDPSRHHLFRDQAGAVSRAQLVSMGVAAGWAAAAVRDGRWQRLYPGVYAAFSGPVPPMTRIWGALLYVGAGAVASHATALWLAGVPVEAPGVVHVSVPATRRVAGQPGLRVHRTGRLSDVTHPSARPSRLILEEAVLDVAEVEVFADRVIPMILGVVQGRFTTADRIRSRLGARRRHRWRALVEELLVAGGEGVHSPLEHRFAIRVERAHGLPHGERNRPEDVQVNSGWGGTSHRRREYRDVRYPRDVVIELDGREAHPGHTAFRDRARDNRLVVDGRVPLRYGWREVVTDPCGVAAEVATVLRARGWTGHPVPCSPGCRVGEPRDRRRDG